MDGRITFEGDLNSLAAANIRLRCAERVLIKLGSFPAESFEGLFEGTRKLPFELFIGKNDAFPVKGHAIKSKLFSVPDCQKIIKSRGHKAFRKIQPIVVLRRRRKISD